jgi:hypothetical protein
MMAPYLACSPKAVPLPKELRGKGERSAVFSREVALVYYLNHDWKEADGGLFVDLQEDTPYTPDFNVLVAFRVPRMHGVTPVAGKRKVSVKINSRTTFLHPSSAGREESYETHGQTSEGNEPSGREKLRGLRGGIGRCRRATPSLAGGWWRASCTVTKRVGATTTATTTTTRRRRRPQRSASAACEENRTVEARATDGGAGWQ